MISALFYGYLGISSGKFVPDLFSVIVYLMGFMDSCRFLYLLELSSNKYCTVMKTVFVNYSIYPHGWKTSDVTAISINRLMLFCVLYIYPSLFLSQTHYED